MEKLVELSELLYEPGEVMAGSAMSNDEAKAYVRERAHDKEYCVVRDWIWIDLDVTEEERNILENTRRQPTVIYAHSVIFDSARRWDVGDYVRTSFLYAFHEGFMFETMNSIYVLLGEGNRKRTSLDTLGMLI
tara:strand:+ start:7082 stop:7480 length:399 start_codon:yes stop_codon:yes gene_type:complete